MCIRYGHLIKGVRVSYDGQRPAARRIPGPGPGGAACSEQGTGRPRYVPHAPFPQEQPRRRLCPSSQPPPAQNTAGVLPARRGQLALGGACQVLVQSSPTVQVWHRLCQPQRPASASVAPVKSEEAPRSPPPAQPGVATASRARGYENGAPGPVFPFFFPMRTLLRH